MKRTLFMAGRTAQALALVAMPSAIWAAEFRKSEREAVTIFVGCMLLFLAGFLVTRLVSRP